MNEVWIVLIDVLVPDTHAKSPGFMNIVVSAETSEEAKAKTVAMVEQYQWELIQIERIDLVDPRRDYSEGVLELIDDVQANPTHIRFSTLHTYPSN